MWKYRIPARLAIIMVALTAVFPHPHAHGQGLSECSISLQTGSTTARARPQCLLSSPGGAGSARFLICPEVTTAFGYDDNAFRADQGAVADAFVRLSPRTTIESIDTEYDIQNTIQLRSERFLHRTENNYVDFNTSTFVSGETGTGLYLAALGRFRRGHENRQSLEAAGNQSNLPNFIEPAAGFGFTYEMASGFVSFEHQTKYRTFTSSESTVAAGRDALTHDMSGCVGTTLSPHTRGLLIGNYSFVNRPDGTGRGANDNETFSVLGRLGYTFTGVTNLQIGLGWLNSGRASDADDRSHTVIARGRLAWRPTDLTTVTAGVSTTVQQTNLGETGISLVRTHTLGVAHDLTPVLDVSFTGAFTTEDVSNSDTGAGTLSGLLTATYQLTDQVLLNARYSRNQRFGRGDATDFASNTWTLAISAAY
jgi:hypothetical protein